MALETSEMHHSEQSEVFTERKRSRSPFTRFRKIKLSGSSSKDTGPKSPPPAEDKEPGFGKRRFSRRFRKRSSKLSVSTEPNESSKLLDKTNTKPPPVIVIIPPDSPPLGQESSDNCTPRSALSDDTVASGSSDPVSPKSTCSDIPARSKKQSARVVLRAIGKKLFTTKSKSPSDTEPPSKKPNSPTSPTSASHRFSVKFPHPKYQSPTPASNDPQTPLATPPIQSVPPSSDPSVQDPKRQKPANGVMAEVLARSRDASAPSNQSAFSRHSQDVRHSDVTDTSAGDYESMSADELKRLLDKSTDFQERSKIRKAIRNIREPEESKGHQGSVSISSKTTGVTLKRNSPIVGNRSPLSGRSKASFNVTFNNNNLTKESIPPWSRDQAKKSSFRSVSSVTFTPSARPPKEVFHSAPSKVPDFKSKKENPPAVNVSFNSVKLSEDTNSHTTPNSRFGKREFSASLRNYKPSYKPPDHVLNRTESLKLSRPKDFIKNSTQTTTYQPLSSRITVQERPVLESVVTSNNVAVKSPNQSSEVKVSFHTVSPPSATKSSTPIPAATSLTPPANTTLQRSESCKENQKSPEETPLPFIPIVRGNKRRSRGILGRVLGFKIDSEKVTSPPKAQEQPKTPPSVSPAKESPKSPPLASPDGSNLIPVQEEVASSKVDEDTPKSPESLPDTPETIRTSKTITLKGNSSDNRIDDIPVVLIDTQRGTTHVQVTCAVTESVTDEKEKVSVTEKPSQTKEEPVDCPSEVELDNTEGINDILVSILDSVEQQVRSEEEVSEYSYQSDPYLDQSQTEEDIPPSPSYSENSNSPQEDPSREETSVVEVIPETRNEDDTPRSSSEDHPEDSGVSVEEISTEQRITDLTFASSVQGNFVRATSVEIQQQEFSSTTAVDGLIETTFITSSFQEESVAFNKDDDSAVDSAFQDQLSQSEVDRESNSSSAGERSLSSGDEDSDIMSSKYSVRSRYGADGGSVKSRILATEGSNKSGTAEVTKFKKSRLTADARALRGSEGVKSRMDKFASKAATTNDSPRITRKIEIKTTKLETNGSAQGSLNGGTGLSRSRDRNEVKESKFSSERKMRYEVNNNDITKTPVISEDKKPNMNGDALDRLESASKATIDEMKIIAQDEEKASSDSIEAPREDSPIDDKIKGSSEEEDISPVEDTRAPPVVEVGGGVCSTDGAKDNESTPEVNGLEKINGDDETSSCDEDAIDRDVEVEKERPASETPSIEEDDVTKNSSLPSDDVSSVSYEAEGCLTPASSPVEGVDLISAFADVKPTEVSISRHDLQDKDQLSITSGDAGEEKVVPKDSEAEKPVRSRRHRRTEAKSTPITSESDAAETTKELPVANKARDDLRLIKLEIADTDVTSTEVSKVTGRRRRRARKSPEDSSESTTASSSAVSTPDRETNSVASSKSEEAESEKSKVESSLSTPEAEADAYITFVATPIASQSEEGDEAPKNTSGEIPTAPEDPEVSHVTPSESSEASEVIEEASGDKITASDADKSELKESSAIKLKRVRSAPEQSIDVVIITDEIDIEPASSNTSKDEIVKKDLTEEEKKSEPKAPEDESTPEAPTMRYTIDNIDDVTEETILQKLLDEAKEYEDRKKIRAALRALRKAGTDGRALKPKEKTTNRWQTSRTTTTGVSVKTAGFTDRKFGTQVTTTTVTTKSEYKETKTPSTGWQRRIGSALDKDSENKSDPKSLAEKYSLSPATTKKDMSGSKKIGSIFDREEEAPKKSGSKLDLERRQAERKREITRYRSMPAGSAKDARKLFVAKLEGQSQSKGTGVKKVGRSPTFVVPNANNVKQMLLKWCQAKTRGYDYVDINNFSSSWASGMAFCALVHNFFPDSFDYSVLDPKNRAHNFDLAFNMAEQHADADPLLEVEDMMIMGNRPDSKCVFTYVQSLYNKLRKFEKPLKPLTPIVKIKGGEMDVPSGKPETSS